MCLLDLSLILKLFTVVTCTFIIGSSTKTEVCLEKHFKNVIRGKFESLRHNLLLYISCQ